MIPILPVEVTRDTEPARRAPALLPVPYLPAMTPPRVGSGMTTSPESPRTSPHAERRLPIGAEPLPGGGVRFRVWAPRRERVAVVLEDTGTSLPLQREGRGYFAGTLPEARPGSRYRYQLDGGAAFPDPASRFQPEGPHGPSEVVDSHDFAWTDHGWRGLQLAGQVLYELHVGTFTREGTWAAAEHELPYLADLGVTAIEVMPVAEFPGRFGWGYDGVNLFAPTRLYGPPAAFRRFVDRAHALGLGVLLDVVYNHLGPDGNYLREFSPDYFSRGAPTDWGEALNFDGEAAGPVREYVLANAGHWIEEYHLDGLRLDATQAIVDTSRDHILAAVGRRARERAGGRSILLISENEPLHTQQVRPEAEGGHGLDGIWNDDFHHAAVVALTGRREGYYRDYSGSPQELVSTAKWGLLFQGQLRLDHRARGMPVSGVPPARFVNFLENHDQIAHSAWGHRLHAIAQPGQWRALTALLLLAPGTPMLFMGQEYAAPNPFLYFADHEPELARLVREGRARFLTEFMSLADPAMQAALADPGSTETVERCRLDLSQRHRTPHAEALALHRDLLRLRREDPAFRAQRERGLDGAVLGPRAFVLRYFVDGGEDRLLLVNLDVPLSLHGMPEPLLAPPAGSGWRLGWSSEDPRYGGGGTPDAARRGLLAPGAAAVVLLPARH
jgi:maltooligosyltrehalose trehalohydrolase